MSNLNSRNEYSNIADGANKEQKDYKRPEFILIDETEEKCQYSHFTPDSQHPIRYYQTEQTKEPSQGGSLRFLCFLGWIFCLIFGLGIFVWSIVMSVLSVCSLFRNSSFNQGACNFWKLWIHTTMAGLGFTIGLIWPPLGFSLIALYFSFIGGMIDNQFLNHIFQSSFNQNS